MTLEPRLALLENNHHCAIYQNQNVIAVIEEVLRNHNVIEIDYCLELKDTYP